MSGPSFSVVIAAYQAAGTVGEAVSSALGQTRPPLEVVVCDDGSTDDLTGALAPFGDAVTLIRQANGGEASAKNAAARAASGDFVVILDADDTFMPERLERLAELAARRPELDVLTTDAWLEVDGRRMRRCYGPGWTFAEDDQRHEILRRNFVFGLAAVRRSRLLELGGFDEALRRTTDWDLWIRMLLRGSAVGAVLEPLATYRVHRASLSADRIGMKRGALQTLTNARRDPALRPEDVPVLEASIAAYGRELRLLEGRAALAAGAPGVRRRMLAMAADSGFPPPARALALAAAVAPGTAGRVQRRRAARTWTGAGATEVAAQ